jgi:hypothetical protein
MTEPNAGPDLYTSFARIAIDYWRLLRAYDRLRGTMVGEDSARLAAQSRYAAERLDSVLGQVGLRMVLFDGQIFHPGLPVEALNAEDFDSEDGLVVAFTSEPTVLAGGRVIALGKVTLQQTQQGVS